MKARVINMSGQIHNDRHDFEQKSRAQKQGSARTRSYMNENAITQVRDRNRADSIFESEPVSLSDLDNLVDLFRNGNTALAIQLFSILNITEKFYVGLASNRVNLLQGKSIAYAFSRIGSQWQKELIIRHQYD